MLIINQNKEVLVNFDVSAGIEIAEGTTKTVITSYITGCSYLLGKYSTKAKAIKVLDMIQEVYEESQLPVIISALLFTDASAVDELKKELSNEKLKNRFVFQMPADSEVVV